MSHIQLINTTLMIHMLKPTYCFRYIWLNILLEYHFFFVYQYFHFTVFDAQWYSNWYFCFYRSGRHISQELNYQLAITPQTWNQFSIRAYVLYRQWLTYVPIVDGFQVLCLACISCRWSYRWISLFRCFLIYIKEVPSGIALSIYLELNPFYLPGSLVWEGLVTLDVAIHEWWYSRSSPG